jgi:uncharacterized membrane protein (DUF373 family)
VPCRITVSIDKSAPADAQLHAAASPESSGGGTRPVPTGMAHSRPSETTGIRMKLPDTIGRSGGLYRLYGRFELVVSAILLILVSVIIVYSLVVLAVTLFEEFVVGARLVEATALKETFGLILSILILVEFNHSIALAMHRRTGVLQVRVIILISIIVIARKLILLDYTNISVEALFGLGGLALALGLLYWLLSHARAPPFAAGTADRENEPN